ncbi:T6SS effector BTH_I2691 family protein [Holophaga foetida]|uniref:T6SS effector BTH_I2691 family protein n=1 Tax=Holophaga foetida TaxID=35839 RepID=UPI0002471D0E|nr:T6SS effector BTH_I2691 family protein [Holophaga foetida]
MEELPSQRFKGYFNGVFDSVDVVSGLAYTHTLGRCYTGVQDKGPCAAYMTKWLKAELTSENLLLRGLVLNLKKTAADIRAAVSPSMDLRGLPWDGLISGFATTVEAVKKDKDAVIVRYIATLGHPIAEVLKGALNGPIRHAAAALGVVSETPRVCVEVVGSKKTFRAMLVKELLGLNKGKPSANQVQMATAAEMKRLEVHGVPMEGTHQQRFLLMVDPEEAKAMPKGLKPQAQAEWLAQSIRTPEEVEALNLAKWQGKLKNGWGKGAPLIFGAVAGICQFLSMSKLSADLEKGTSFEKTENQWRHGASVAAFAGTLGELMGGAIEMRPSIFWTESAALGIKTTGRVLGFVAGLVMAGVDGCKGWGEWKNGNNGLAYAYGISAMVGGGAAICFLLASTFVWLGPVGWLLVVLSVGISVLIEYIKDNKLQEWLKRGCWGTLRDKEGYGNMETEIGDFNAAMGG